MADLMTWIEDALAACPERTFQAKLHSELEERIHKMTTTGVREGFTTITPYVIVVEIERLVDFAKQVFGAVETSRAPGSAGGIHCELRIGDSMLMFGGGPALRGYEKRNTLHLQAPDTDAVYQRALEAGAESLFEQSDKPYGARDAGVRDPAGNSWFIATPLRPRPEPPPTVTPYLLIDNDPLGYIEFLKSAFNAEQIAAYKSPDGLLMHAELRIGGAPIEMGQAPGLQCAFYLYVPDADALYERAMAAGAKSVCTPMDQPWGDRMGGVEDPWGNALYIASHFGSGRR